MPYVIFQFGRVGLPASRAAATIDDARRAAQDVMLDRGAVAYPAWPVGSNAQNWTASLNLPGAGGKIGPLPDGTVVDVMKVSPLKLAASIRPRPPGIGALIRSCLDEHDWQPLVDAYNDAQASA